MITPTSVPKLDVHAACTRGLNGAADALASLLSGGALPQGRRVALLRVVEDLAPYVEHDASVFIEFGIEGGLRGRLTAVLPGTSAQRIAERLVGRAPCALHELDAAFGGALSETGNIVASAFLNGVADTVGQACWPSVPDLRVTQGERQLNAALGRVSQHENGAFLLAAEVDHGEGPMPFALVLRPA